MAKKTRNTFSLLVLLIAVSLLGAAALVYLQPGSGSGGGNNAALAALSQAIPGHAARAANGAPRAFDQLDNDIKRLDRLTAGAGRSLPGSSAQWQALRQSTAAVLAQRNALDSISNAVAYANEHIPLLQSNADALLGQTGATAAVQEFQRRAETLRVSLAELGGDSTDQTSQAIAEDLAYLRQVTGGLAGESTNLDIVALDTTAREVALVPVISELTEIESQVEMALAAAPELGDIREAVAAVDAAAKDLFASAFPVSSGSSATAGLSGLDWLPIGLVVAALLMLLVLTRIHSKAAVFERTSVEQSEQNERNQQAILRLLDELGSLADGDLTVEATVTEDITGAIADSINYAIEKLRELVATINETAIMVDSAAKQTESTAVHMARAAENQAKEINAATGSIVSMAGSIEEVSGNAERSSDVARHSVDVAHKGGEAVRRTIDGMNTIRETIQDTSKRIKRLGESSQEIGNIVELINDIAEQTNILALNASIQASMAGEAGRGFAVVADEVQRLAERSTNATKQIEVLVRTIQADTNEAVVSMERSTTDVVGGALLAENAGAALDEIEQVSNQIANLVQNISSSARQQASSAADVTRRTTKLKEISDQAGKATSATAAAISKLSELASQLRQTVAGFTLPSSALKASPLSSAAAPQAPPQTPPPRAEAKDQAAG
jgi:twitching motility protein PilJ